MTREQYHALVERVEEYARRHPEAYKIRLGLLALFGYAYIWLMLAVIAAVLALLVLLAETLSGGVVMALLKLGWPLVVLAYAILRALWVRFPRPEGIEIVRRDAPELFRAVDDLRRTLACPRFHHVLLTDEWNAGVVQRPRLGPFGWYENYLELGVPLMAGLTPEAFHAVLAHEFGHLSRSHGRFGSWIYRIRATWSHLLESLGQAGHRWRGVFEAFLNRFAPYFNAYSFVLARTREREADRVAGELAGRETLGRALVALSLGDALLKRRYWPSVERLTHDQAVTPERVAPPHATDGLSAADQFLGDTARTTLTGLDRTWRDRAAHGWRDRHSSILGARARLEDIAARAAAGPLPPELVWERIQLTLKLHGDAEAEPLLREALAANPEHVGASFLLGRLLLERSDPAGEPYLERAMEGDPGCVREACDVLATFHELAGRDPDAARYRVRARAGADLLEQAEGERQGVEPSDRFLPHDLPAEEIERLRGEISGFYDVRRAWLVRKAVRFLPEFPLYVLGVELGRWYHLRSARDNQEAVHGLATKVAYPGRAWIIHLDRKRATIAKKLKRVKGAEIFRR